MQPLDRSTRTVPQQHASRHQRKRPWPPANSATTRHVTVFAWVASEATVICRVTLGEGASVWPGASIRGDNEPITLGRAVNIQEGAVLHVDTGFPLTISDGASIGHQAMLHGCTVGENSLIGIQAIVMNGAVTGRDSLVGAGAVVTEGKVFPERSLIVGAPARVVRQLTDEQVVMLKFNSEHYVGKQNEYKTQLKRLD